MINRRNERDSYFLNISSVCASEKSFVDHNTIIQSEKNTTNRSHTSTTASDGLSADYISFLKGEIDFLKCKLKQRNEMIAMLMPCSIKKMNVETRPPCKVNEDIALSTPDVIKIRAHENHASGTKTNDNFVNHNTNTKIQKLSSKENIKVRNFTGTSTEDMKDYANPIIRKKTDLIIFHAGMTDITNKCDTIINLQAMVNKVKTRIAISSVISRQDKKQDEKAVVDLNLKLKLFCDFIKMITLMNLV